MQEIREMHSQTQLDSYLLNAVLSFHWDLMIVGRVYKLLQQLQNEVDIHSLETT